MDVHAVPGADHVAHGVRLHVVAHGRADAGTVPVLLLHGLPTTSYLWRDVMRDLSRHTATVAPDLAGCGRSERPPGRLGLARQARLVAALLDELEIDRMVVVGHGLGGAIAVHLATLAPERVAGLVLTSAPVHADAWPPTALLPLLVPGVRTVAPALLRALGDGRLGRHGTDAYLGTPRSAAQLRGLRQLTAAVDMVGVEAAWDLLRLTPPQTLVLWGEQDTVHRLSYGRRITGELPTAALVPVPEAGHLLPAERPERVAEEIAAFAAEVGMEDLPGARN